MEREGSDPGLPRPEPAALHGRIPWKVPIIGVEIFTSALPAPSLLIRDGGTSLCIQPGASLCPAMFHPGATLCLLPCSVYLVTRTQLLEALRVHCYHSLLFLNALCDPIHFHNVADHLLAHYFQISSFRSALLGIPACVCRPAITPLIPPHRHLEHTLQN